VGVNLVEAQILIHVRLAFFKAIVRYRPMLQSSRSRFLGCVATCDNTVVNENPQNEDSRPLLADQVPRVGPAGLWIP